MHVDEAISIGSEYLSKSHYSELVAEKYKREWLKYAVFLNKSDMSSEVSIASIHSYLKAVRNIDIEHDAELMDKFDKQCYRCLITLDCLANNKPVPRAINLIRFRVPISKDFADLNQEFKNFLVSHAYSERSVTSYISATKLFLSHIHVKFSVTDPADISDKHAISFLSQYDNKRSRKNLVNALNVFGKFLVQSGRQKVSFMLTMPSISGGSYQNINYALTEEQLVELLSALDTETAIGKRNALMVVLASFCGMRIGDITKLKFKNINLDGKFITFVMSKTSKPHSISYKGEVVEAYLTDYLDNGRPSHLSRESNDFVIVSHSAPYGRLRGNQHGMLQRFLDYASICASQFDHSGMHLLRHTYASMLVNNDVPLTQVAMLMGHSCIDQTVRYIQLNQRKMRLCAIPESFCIHGGRDSL